MEWGLGWTGHDQSSLMVVGVHLGGARHHDLSCRLGKRRKARDDMSFLAGRKTNRAIAIGGGGRWSTAAILCWCMVTVCGRSTVQWPICLGPDYVDVMYDAYVYVMYMWFLLVPIHVMYVSMCIGRNGNVRLYTCIMYVLC